MNSVKKEYHKLARKWHPDKNSSPLAIEKFQDISNTYNTIKNISECFFNCQDPLGIFVDENYISSEINILKSSITKEYFDDYSLKIIETKLCKGDIMLKRINTIKKYFNGTIETNTEHFIFPLM